MTFLRLGSRRPARGCHVQLIGTAKLNDVDPQAWLADVLDCIAGHHASRLDELLPWHWRQGDRVLSLRA